MCDVYRSVKAIVNDLITVMSASKILFKVLLLLIKPIILTTNPSEPQSHTVSNVAVHGLVMRRLWQQIHMAIGWLKMNLGFYSAIYDEQ